ncbi:MAG: BLUF domain-containing protein [Pseudolabrys sp.]
MFHLIYSSRETQEFSAADLKKLLVGARLRNREVDATGILVYHDGMFLQALEGPEAAVRAIFARIEKDPRHGDINVLQQENSLGKRRVFGDWSMGFADASGASQILKGFVELNERQSLAGLGRLQAMTVLETCSRKSSVL